MIELKNVRKSYPDGNSRVEVLHDVSFEIGKGRYAAITGPSGSGKSTLLHLIGGLEPADTGEIRVAGKPVHQMNDTELARLRLEDVGYVFQQFQLLPTATALENVMMPLLATKPPKDLKVRAKQALDRVGLAHRASHLPSRMSGGEQQRTAIARALITQPKIILADEPTGNLDTETGSRIISLLEEIHRDDGATIVLITHDPSLAERAEDQIYVRDGKAEKIIGVQ
ncbi:ABC transporter ATP-binding protein [Bhargavaea ullalensis]|uniref:ABC transport system ATP-binding protein n=1 Tax=Bhargavaea ullalensis TaxID=1265685 RepID=A0ABV2GBA8_9BACL